MVNYYFVEKNMVLMTGEYDQHGKLCSRVMVGNLSFLVERTNLQILDDTLKYIGLNLKGSIVGAKSILGNRCMCPFIVNPYQGICLFPDKSPTKDDCIWFNPDHIINTTAIGNKTEVKLSNGHSIIVDSKRSHFNNKIETANQLKRTSLERGNHPSPITLYLEPKKGRQLCKERNGKYNFNCLEENTKE
ncbi:competence protein ComK [Bacillus sp. MRMR6]|uniref:competence protein ComK n=1 Tax=Bacillus sp. MRMR6 TaxID=1928617 RepID=UPI0026DA8685|nr:competence protein ComK [Bacillus sp. MRMR6]